jgi:hypothetical protein
MAKFQVQSEPVSFKGRLYAAGETFEASEQEAAGWLQAGYVKKQVKPKSKSK